MHCADDVNTGQTVGSIEYLRSSYIETKLQPLWIYFAASEQSQDVSTTANHRQLRVILRRQNVCRHQEFKLIKEVKKCDDGFVF